MAEVFLAALALLSASNARVIPRPDGAILEFVSDTPIEPSVGCEGCSVHIATGGTIEPPPTPWSIWIDEIRTAADSCELIVTGSPLVLSVDWALSADSLTLLVFFRAGTVLNLPSLSWAGPPEEPPALLAESSDSLAMSALSSGLPAPWLAEFDCIVLDPGHGGRDPGAVGPGGSAEKDRNLEIALLVRDLLAVEMPSVRVVMTRSDDRYVSLGERTRIANRERADLFLSIHCNASTNRAAGGFETYFLSLARTDDARAVAAMENSAAELDSAVACEPSADALSFLLADMAQNLYLSQSSSLAELVQQGISRVWEGGSDRGVKQAGFYVLRGAWMPSILVEVAFISNPAEERLLRDLDFRFRAASAIVSGIRAFANNQGR